MLSYTSFWRMFWFITTILFQFPSYQFTNCRSTYIYNMYGPSFFDTCLMCALMVQQGIKRGGGSTAESSTPQTVGWPQLGFGCEVGLVIWFAEFCVKRHRFQQAVELNKRWKFEQFRLSQEAKILQKICVDPPTAFLEFLMLYPVVQGEWWSYKKFLASEISLWYVKRELTINEQ